MTLVTFNQAAQELGVARWTIRDRVIYGHMPGHKIVQLGRRRPTWMVDLDLARAHFAKHPVREQQSHLRPQGPIVLPAMDGGLNLTQRNVLDSEPWHRLLECVPDRLCGRGAYRCTWSDGECYTLMPDGEQEKFSYILFDADREDEVDE